MNTDNYPFWLDDEKRDRLKRMAEALRNDLVRTDGIGSEMRKEALGRVERWLQEAKS